MIKLGAAWNYLPIIFATMNIHVAQNFYPPRRGHNALES